MNPAQPEGTPSAPGTTTIPDMTTTKPGGIFGGLRGALNQAREMTAQNQPIVQPEITPATETAMPSWEQDIEPKPGLRPAGLDLGAPVEQSTTPTSTLTPSSELTPSTPPPSNMQEPQSTPIIPVVAETPTAPAPDAGTAEPPVAPVLPNAGIFNAAPAPEPTAAPSTVEPEPPTPTPDSTPAVSSVWTPDASPTLAPSADTAPTPTAEPTTPEAPLPAVEADMISASTPSVELIKPKATEGDLIKRSELSPEAQERIKAVFAEAVANGAFDALANDLSGSTTAQPTSLPDLANSPTLDTQAPLENSNTPPTPGGSTII